MLWTTFIRKLTLDQLTTTVHIWKACLKDFREENIFVMKKPWNTWVKNDRILKNHDLKILNLINYINFFYIRTF